MSKSDKHKLGEHFRFRSGAIFAKGWLPARSFFFVIILIIVIIYIVWNAETAEWQSFERRAAGIAIAFGILALVSWILSLLIYQEVRSYVGGGGKLLDLALKKIPKANNHIRILALAPNIGQAFFLNQFEKFHKCLAETLHERQAGNNSLNLEFITLEKDRIRTFLIDVGESHLRKCYWEDDEIIRSYRKPASEFFSLVANWQKTHWWTIPLRDGRVDPITDIFWSFTAIAIDNTWAGIIMNKSLDGFECKNAYEVQVILAVFEILKKVGTPTKVRTAADVLPQLDANKNWV